MLDEVMKNYRLGEMAEKCDSLSSSATIADFVKLARQKNMEVMPIVGEDGKLVGIVTEKDLIKLMKVEGASSNYPIIERKLPREILAESISSIMTQDPVTLKETDTMEDALNMILNHDFRRIIIVDSEGKLIGKIRIVDIIHNLSKEEEKTEK
ncbi:MAG: CBS domain-containing protein [Candidatus Aenigmarchaeota archaeon]|nr:CBS domain-containing protein [Candidatus Aenigmarchaeota archaeon]